ncbi:hypothetical protein GZH47_21895 [Paenibacillus rhizovicinus]|uniref:SLH domain-containing protein n=1 Tax=Paenibacillus rhizovicinus TaxID=2704463 RepID=A0A6C0P635_9BACL|nr:S-layer homology domain-containing protein [Paenibacillus rhizovicinus]QHW33173.1 hypothetical protein GZH47_21895 [Paenibacillus rhizovicinus]
MSRKLLFGFLICLLIGAQGLAPARAAAVQSFALKAITASPAADGSIKIELQGKNLADVYAFDVTLSYDAGKLRFKEAASSIAGMSTEPILTDGQVRFAHTKIGKTAGVSGSATLAAFTFEEIGTGSAKVAIQDLKLVDSKLAMTELHPDAGISVLASAAGKFSDLGAKWSWAAESINYLASHGIVGGTGNGKYEPAQSVKRGDLILMLVRAFNLKSPQTDGGNFADVPKGKYYYDAIAAAKALGIATGDGAGFKPEAAVSRQEMMVMIDRTLHAIGKELPEPSGKELDGFADKGQVADYAAKSVAALVKAGIVKGGTVGIEPAKSTNRAEMAVILYRILMLQQQ